VRLPFWGNASTEAGIAVIEAQKETESVPQRNSKDRFGASAYLEFRITSRFLLVRQVRDFDPQTVAARRRLRHVEREVLHQHGERAALTVERDREAIAELLGAIDIALEAPSERP
jgi:outer membrane lipopolysaccharide assembly protein LptE/RlpB